MNKPPVQPLRLLVFDKDASTADRLLTGLREQHVAARATAVTSEMDFETRLASEWDACFVGLDDVALIQRLLDLMAGSRQGMPLFALDWPDTVPEKLLQTGLFDEVSTGETTLLARRIETATSRLRLKKLNNQQALQIRELSRQLEGLMITTEAPIAYIADGLHIDANPAYLQRLGFTEVDDMLGTSLIDIVAKEARAEFKQFLATRKKQHKPADECINLDIGLEGHRCNTRLCFSRATYENDTCDKLTIVEDLGAPAGLKPVSDNVSGEDPVRGLINHIHDCQLSETEETGSPVLAILTLQQPDRLLQTIGWHHIHALAAQVELRLSLSETQKCFRLAHSTWAVIQPYVSPGTIISHFESLVGRINHEPVEIEGLSVQPMCTAGITYITAQHNAEDVLQEAWLAASRGTNERPAILCKDGEDSVNSQVPIKAAQAAMEQAMADDNFKAYSLPVSTLHGTRGTFFELMATLQENDDQPETPATLVLNQLKNPELYCRFDRWLVTNTLKLMSEQAEDATEHYHAFIRISKHSMLDRDFPGWVLKNLEVSGRPTSSIVLFVDEQDVSVSIKETKDFIAPLHQAGVAIGIGQFGTSANPEGILQQLDVEFACIDLSLIEGIDSNKEAMALFRQHLNSAHKNGLATVVPGIQDMSMYQELWDAGVHYTESCEGMGADEADVFDFSVIFGADPR